MTFEERFMSYCCRFLGVEEPRTRARGREIHRIYGTGAESPHLHSALSRWARTPVRARAAAAIVTINECRFGGSDLGPAHRDQCLRILFREMCAAMRAP